MTLKKRVYMDVRFDVTLLNEDERATLCGDVCVQHESVDYEDPDANGHVRGHPGVPYPEVEWNEVEIDDPIYDWIGWEDGEELSPPEPGKRWLTITEDGEEMAVIVHRMTDRLDPEHNAQMMTAKIRRAQRIVEALNASKGAASDGMESWFVGKAGVTESMPFNTRLEAEAAIAGISLIDPEGVAQGMYFIDPPDHEERGE